MNSIRVEIPMETIMEALQLSGIKSRMDDMIDRYGEFCSYRKAMEILRCGMPKLDSLMAEGLLLPACDGDQIDVRSICRYIECGGHRRGRTKKPDPGSASSHRSGEPRRTV